MLKQSEYGTVGIESAAEDYDVKHRCSNACSSFSTGFRTLRRQKRQ